ncbi:MAG TPA: DUF3592 domain-containing protein [Allosphingosinicella sp.]|nr:DUF3592 domain-containing protein [Allosphingosinicella sp.]
MESIGTLLLLFGLLWLGGFAFIHFRAVAKARASETWPTAMGKVTRSEVVVEEDNDRDGTSTTWHNPIVAYSYAVAGEPIEGSRIRFANMRRGSRKKAEEILARYRVGDSVTVRYNPEKPKEAVLESRKPGPLYLVMALAGLIFIAVGLLWGSMA